MESEIKHTESENLEIDPVSADEVQKVLFESWFKTSVLVKKLSSYKVPPKITKLPCGCTRERTNEVDVNNVWKIKRKNSTYTHKECGTQIELK